MGSGLVVARNTPRVAAASWGSTVPLPGADPAENTFPKLYQALNGSLWLVWAKLAGTYSEIYQMVNNGFGWSGQTALINSNGAHDDIDPALAQLGNGTMMMVWARGSPGTGGCFGTTAYTLYIETSSGNRWSLPSPLVTSAGDNISPALAKLADGRVFLAWSKCTPTNGFGDIYYKIFNGTWGPDTPLATTLAQEKLPCVAQTLDGRVWVAYTSNPTGTDQLYYTIWNGTSWTTLVQLTSTSNPDDWPSMVQDRAGTLWAFWARLLPNGTLNGQPSYQSDIFYKNSTDYGLNWSPDQPLATLINSDEKQPSIIQNTDKRLYIVYSSDQKLGNPYGTPNLFLTTSGIIKAHDLAVESLTPSSTLPATGDQVNLTTTVANLGDYADSSNLNYYANSNLVQTRAVTLQPGQTLNLTLTWDSTGWKPGRYILNATIIPVPGQVSARGDSLNTTIYLWPRGDVDRDGTVDISDIVLIASHFGATRGSPNWYAPADLANKGVIDISDLAICGGQFGESVGAPSLGVLALAVPRVNPRVGETVTVNVTLTNFGPVTASTTVSLYSNQTRVASLPVTLSFGQRTTLSFPWNSTGAKPGRYVLTGTIAPAPGELGVSNHSMNSTIFLTFKGDVNRDGRVDIIDLALVANHFGAARGAANYFADADLNRDGVIDIDDLVVCGAEFGKYL